MTRRRYGWLHAGLVVAAGLAHGCGDSTRPPAPDTIPPGPVTDLRVLTTGDSSITLTWTAPGDDGTEGRAARYEIRHSWDAARAYYWINAVPLDTVLIPHEPGSPETLRVDHLGNLHYYFALRTYDEAGNVSLASNVSGTTVGDHTPPATVQDLRVIGTTAGSVTLTWTAPGEDSLEGVVAAYEIRYSRDFYGRGWKYLSQTSFPGPYRKGGEAETTRATGLMSNVDYRFALRTRDDSDNWSAVSNVVLGTTLVDTDPPGKIEDLHVVGTSGRTMTLEWTAPGDDGAEGTVISYEIRFAEFPIEDRSWSVAQQAKGPPFPHRSGLTERVTVYYLMPSTAYTFAVKGVDEAGNRSPLSHVVAATTSASGGVWHVLPDGSGDFPTIQAAIDSVPAGDLILVAPGTYPECLNFGDKDVVVRSEAGPEATILAGCGDTGREVALFRSGTTRNAVLDGFAVTGAAGPQAIGVASGSPTIVNNIIRDNHARGILLSGGEAVVRGNQFLNNRTGSWAGGMYIGPSKYNDYPAGWSSPLIENNLFDSNRGRFGGAIYAAYTRAIIRDNTFRNNSCEYDGGAIFLWPTTDRVVIENNVFFSNVANDHGGAVAAWNYQNYEGSGWADIRGNLMVDNEALGEGSFNLNGIGGAIHVSGINGTITNNTIVRNRSGYCGGGGITLYLDTGDSPWFIERNIIAFNTDGGLSCFRGDASRVRDNLLFGNAYDFGCKPGVCDSTVIAANRVADPLFCDPEGGDWRVSADSPALTDPSGPIGAFSNPGCSFDAPRNPKPVEPPPPPLPRARP